MSWIYPSRFLFLRPAERCPLPPAIDDREGEQSHDEWKPRRRDRATFYGNRRCAGHDRDESDRRQRRELSADAQQAGKNQPESAQRLREADESTGPPDWPACGAPSTEP